MHCGIINLQRSLQFVFIFQIEGMYTKAHAAIRKDPEHKPAPKKKVQKKRWNAKKLTLEEFKAKVSKQKEEFMAQIEAQRD